MGLFPLVQQRCLGARRVRVLSSSFFLQFLPNCRAFLYVDWVLHTALGPYCGASVSDAKKSPKKALSAIP